MGNEIKRIDAKEFQEIGFLQEANRLFFHPHGLALEVMKHDDGTVTLGGVWDYRDDPEGIVFADRPDADKAQRVAAERERHTDARVALIGQEVQPLDWSLQERRAEGTTPCEECGAPMKPYGGVHNSGCPKLGESTAYVTSQGVGVEREEPDDA